jgi:RNA polymerase sigma-54 factor
MKEDAAWGERRIAFARRERGAIKRDEVEGLLQPKLNLRVSQRQVLTPGLVQMVSVLALNKLELREMINTEMVENPVLEEVEESAVTIEEMAGREAERERSAEEVASEAERVGKDEKDPFDEIDFGSYFQDYLDPGFRTASSFEEYDRPSFENFLSQPNTLTDHLEWQLGSMSLDDTVRLATDLVVGNLNEDGYLTSTDEELVEALMEARRPTRVEPIPFERGVKARPAWETNLSAASPDLKAAQASEGESSGIVGHSREYAAALATVQQACAIINNLDPLGVGARDLRECLMIQIAAQRREAELVLRRALVRAIPGKEDSSQDRAADDVANGRREAALPFHPIQRGQEAVHGATSRNGTASDGAVNHEAQCAEREGDLFEVAIRIVANHLLLLQKKDMRELTRSCGRTVEEVQAAVEFIRTLDPRPGQRYNLGETRLIEPDVAFVKRDGEYVVVMNEEDMPTLRLSRAYRRMLREKKTEKDVREYVKERYKSAIQLLRNIEQRKNTILRTCEVIVRRQADFLERGEQGLRPMMIKEVAEEIGVHPSTVSRAVANKYVHTTQGVYELRYFFTEGVNGPEGGDLPLVLLKQRVKKLIEDEDPHKPLTDDHLAAELQRQGIRVTRRTVAKYREDMRIPSTHQRRVR